MWFNANWKACKFYLNVVLLKTSKIINKTSFINTFKQNIPFTNIPAVSLAFFSWSFIFWNLLSNNGTNRHTGTHTFLSPHVAWTVSASQCSLWWRPNNSIGPLIKTPSWTLEGTWGTDGVGCWVKLGEVTFFLPCSITSLDPVSRKCKQTERLALFSTLTIVSHQGQ